MPTVPLSSSVASGWTAAMRRGDFEAAWRETDRLEVERRRLERAGKLVWQPQHLLWTGADFTDREVLVRCQHGLGDTLQFVRFLPQLQQRAGSVTLLAQPPLVDFLQAQPQLAAVRNGWTDFRGPERALEIEVMELAYALRCTAETVAPSQSYLRAGASPHPSLEGALQVGLLWAASDWDPRRSIPLPLFEVLGGTPGVRFHSLQQGAQAPEWRDSRLGLSPLSERTQEIAEAAAAMMQLDLIITVDGMAAHLAGALGRPVWVLLQHDADWRWGEARPDSPWYPTMRLFRQPRPGAWEPVVEAVAAALARELSTPERRYR